MGGRRVKMDRMEGKQLVNKVLVLLVIATVAGAALGGLWLLPPGDADASGHNATRSFSATSVAPGGTVEVTVTGSNYGRLGRIVETAPDAFGGGTFTLNLLGENQSVSYTVTAEDSPGSYTFSGTIYDEDGGNESVTGPSTVRITGQQATPQPPPTPEPQLAATRSFSATSVAPGGTVEVTVTGSNYGRLGRIVETAPDAFGGGTFTLNLLGENQSVSYTVTAEDSPGSYTFSGTIYDEDGGSESVTGPSTVRITGQQATPQPPPTPEPQLAATRSFSATSVAPGGTVEVTVTGSNYGRLGRIVETAPDAFGGGTFTLNLLGENQSVSYTVTAEDSPGSYTFSGTIYDEDGGSESVTGPSTVRIAGQQATPQPPTNRAPAFAGETTSRSVQEDQSANMAIGAPVRATDPDGDSLTYTLGGSDAATFSIGRTSGQLMARAALDYETKPSYSLRVTARDNRGGSDTIAVAVAVTNVEEQGTVTLNPDRPLVGTALTASLTDPDGGVTGETWRWSRSDAADGTFTDIRGATRASYTPVEADEGMYLKITVTYTDGHGPDKTATASAMVPPPSNSPPRFSETAPTRSIAENSAAGTAVGAPVRATDSDGDSLTYTLGGSDAATFSIGRTSGQLMTRAALDYETKPSYSVGVTARDNRGGSDTTTVAVAVTNVEEQGTVTLNPDRPLVGTALTASLTDPDGGVTGETWRWSRSDAADGTFTGIGGATRASYTPVEADDGMYLKITVTYTDGHGPNKTATAGAMVSDPLIARYDANKDGTIEIRELFNAIDHYFDGTIEIRELFKVIDYYFDG